MSVSGEPWEYDIARDRWTHARGSVRLGREGYYARTKWLAEMPEPFPLLDDAKAAVERGYDARTVLSLTVEDPDLRDPRELGNAHDPRDGAW